MNAGTKATLREPEYAIGLLETALKAEKEKHSHFEVKPDIARDHVCAQGYGYAITTTYWRTIPPTVPYEPGHWTNTCTGWTMPMLITKASRAGAIS